MFIRLLALFIIVPLVELYLLLRLADVTSPMTTFLIVIVTGVIGSMLARREGVMAWYRFRSAVAEGRVPSTELQDGLMIVFAAALLLTPGLLTDALGFTLLVPVGRSLMRRFVLSRYIGRFSVQVGGDRSSDSQPFGESPVHGQASQFGPSSGTHPSRGSYTIDATAVRRK